MNYPQWKKSDWSETRFGVTMKDEYIGLEQPKDPAVLNWVAAENALTDQFFSTLPGYAPKKEQLQARPFYASYSAVTETPEGYWATRANQDGTRTLVVLDKEFKEDPGSGSELDSGHNHGLHCQSIVYGSRLDLLYRAGRWRWPPMRAGGRSKGKQTDPQTGRDFLFAVG